MKVICKANKLTSEQKKLVSIEFTKSDFHITVGKEYLIFAITILSIKGRIQTLIEYITDYGNLVTTPIMLFDIIDSRVSKYWEMKIDDEDGSVLLWPPSFYKEYYHDDLFEEEPEIVADFRYVRKKFEEEFA